MKFLGFYLITLLLITSCTYNELSVCETDTPSFSYCVMPIFTDHCISCHSPDSGLDIMPLTDFIEIQDEIINGTIIESINREIGFMPKNAERLSAEQILIIEKWNENGTPNN